jgi:hypothetical protein
MLSLVAFSVCSAAYAQTGTAINSDDQFLLPENGGSIGFMGPWTYENAALENGTWAFTNLQFVYLGNVQTLLSLQVSTQQSNITLYLHRTSNTSLSAIVLRYSVAGQGVQAFNFGHVPKDGEWSLSLNGVIAGRYDGWSVSSDGTVTVNCASSGSNVSLTYYVPGQTLSDPNQPFYLQHSVAIFAGALVAVVVVLAVAIALKNKKPAQTSHAEGEPGKVINKPPTQQRTGT